jgi:predicted nucleic acid-binding protein
MNELIGRTVYLDTNVFIYAVEGFEVFRPLIELLFDHIDSGKIKAVTSMLTLSECLVKPYREHSDGIIAVYNDCVKNSEYLTVADVSRNVLADAAKLRAYNLCIKLPDAIHISTAISQKCDFIITNDKKMKNDAVELVYLNDFVGR